MENMVAGPELDLLIAEKVMGCPAPSEPGISQREYELRRGQWHPEYSTDIAAAWTVVDKLGVDFHLFYFETRGRFTKVNIALHGEQGKFVDAHADTAPLAICLAALKAINYPIQP